MFLVSSRARAVLAATAVAALLTACGSAPDPADPGPSPDLFQYLPAPASPPSAAATVAPMTTTTVPTSKVSIRVRPATAAPPHLAHMVSTPGTIPTQTSAAWKPVGGDEFDGPALDTEKWGVYDSIGGFGNGTRSPKAVTQSDGSLVITATPGSGGVSGGMGDSFGQTYGRWEFRARTDDGRGFGSAILLWPDSEKQDDGELDMMEVPFEKRDLAHFVVHSGPGGHTLIGDRLAGDYSGWHTFAMDWLPDHITWYVDGVQQFEVTDKTRIPTRPMHIAIQLDQGPVKDWILAPDATTPPATRLQVDWVRIYAPATPVATTAPAPPVSVSDTSTQPTE